MRKLKLFEEFTEEQMKFFINNDLTYIKKNDTIFAKKVGVIFDKIRNYDIEKFNISTTYVTIITPDNDFIKLLIELNEILPKDSKIDININFELSVNYHLYNEINLDFNLPDILMGLNIGYKIYKLMVKKNNYITSKYGLSKFAKHIWYKNLIDSDYYCFTSSKSHSGAILKDISNEKLFLILENIKTIIKDAIFDSKLEKKIIEFYGTIENYKK